MLKLDPGQIVWLREHAPAKGMVEAFVRGLGEWFENNGETFAQTVEWVVAERGEDVAELREGVRGGWEGVVGGGEWGGQWGGRVEGGEREGEGEVEA